MNAQSRPVSVDAGAVNRLGGTGAHYKVRGVLTRILELLRFSLIGTVSVILNFVIIVFLTQSLGVNYLVSITICFATVTFVSFWLNRVWTFRKRASAAKSDLVRYTGMTIIQYVLYAGACGIAVGAFGVPYQLAVVMFSIAFAPINYLLHRYWSFSIRWVQ